MADIIEFVPEAKPEPRPEEFIGDPVDWIAPISDEEEEEFAEQNAIHLFWIGINQLQVLGYENVPNLLRLIADEVAWQIEHGSPKENNTSTLGSTTPPIPITKDGKTDDEPSPPAAA